VFQTVEFLSNLSLWHDSKIHSNGIGLLKAAEKPAEFGCNKIGHFVSADAAAKVAHAQRQNATACPNRRPKISQCGRAEAVCADFEIGSVKSPSVLPCADVER
jgi:hypothetical protein